jgi:hypothetical protein
MKMDLLHLHVMRLSRSVQAKEIVLPEELVATDRGIIQTDTSAKEMA